eukprot:6793800-Pyramimonas_sp.AAC.1
MTTEVLITTLNGSVRSCAIRVTLAIYFERLPCDGGLVITSPFIDNTTDGQLGVVLGKGPMRCQRATPPWPPPCLIGQSGARKLSSAPCP